MIVSGATLAEMAVTDEDFHKLLTAIAALSQPQLTALDAAIRGRLGTATAQPAAADKAPEDAGKPAGDCASISDIEARFAAAPRCPHCQSTTVTKWGSANAMRRYRCRACKVTFNALTGTPLAQLHKRELWIGHSQALVDGLSLRKVAARLDIDLTTAFRWRHRFLKTPKTSNQGFWTVRSRPTRPTSCAQRRARVSSIARHASAAARRPNAACRTSRFPS